MNIIYIILYVTYVTLQESQYYFLEEGYTHVETLEPICELNL